MKPNTHTVDDALHVLGAEPARRVFIGDLVSDVEFSRAVGMPCIGYAKAPRRGAEPRAAGALSVIEDMAELDARI